jgi:hypothetical protein
MNESISWIRPGTYTKHDLILVNSSFDRASTPIASIVLPLVNVLHVAPTELASIRRNQISREVTLGDEADLPVALPKSHDTLLIYTNNHTNA